MLDCKIKDIFDKAKNEIEKNLNETVKGKHLFQSHNNIYKGVIEEVTVLDLLEYKNVRVSIKSTRNNATIYTQTYTINVRYGENCGYGFYIVDTKEAKESKY